MIFLLFIEMICLFTLLYIVLFVISGGYILKYNTKIIQGSIKCIDKGLYKTCIYKNVYYIHNKWIIYTDNYKYNNICVNTYAKKLGVCWDIHKYSFKINRNNELIVDKIVRGVNIPFRLTYRNNYGHALWDDLYSVYTSIVKAGLKDTKFNLIVQKLNRNSLFLKDIYSVIEKFSQGKYIILNSFTSKVILFETLVVGSSHQCQRCVTFDYSLKYSREYNITKLYRDRIYKVYNIKPSFKYPLEGIIIHNKRYSSYEIDILKNITQIFLNNKKLILHYIDFRNIPTFYEQLKLMSRIHIYISGPGTGLMNFPFMSDPGVVIHLGHIHFGCPQYLEQYMLEGSPHFKAIYYSPERRMEKMNLSYLINMIETSLKYIQYNPNIYIKKGDNLNPIGKLFVEICSEHKHICKELLHNYDWGYGKCRGIWAENVVYFPSLYTKIPQLKEIVISYNKSKNLGCLIGVNFSKQKQCNK